MTIPKPGSFKACRGVVPEQEATIDIKAGFYHDLSTALTELLVSHADGHSVVTRHVFLDFEAFEECEIHELTRVLAKFVAHKRGYTLK